DEKWCVWHDRGFTWWAGELAQHVWAEPTFTVDGTTYSTVHVRTDLFEGFDLRPEQLETLYLIMNNATLSGPAREPTNPSRIQMASAAIVHDEGREWREDTLVYAALLQLSEAYLQFERPALRAGFEPARSAHPELGIRDSVDPRPYL